MVKTQPFRGILGPQKNEAGGFFVARGGEWAGTRRGGSYVWPWPGCVAFLILCRSMSGAPCRLSRAESERRCRVPGQPPGGALCHNRGRCECGVCICQVTEPGTYFGPLCECHDWVCQTYDGKTCSGKAQVLCTLGVTCLQTSTELNGCNQRRPCFCAILALFIIVFLLLFDPHLSGIYKHVCRYVYIYFTDFLINFTRLSCGSLSWTRFFRASQMGLPWGAP